MNSIKYIMVVVMKKFGLYMYVGIFDFVNGLVFEDRGKG